jgi:hypothetical protein
MVLQALKTTGVRVATAQARRAGARRNMGGHAPAPEWTGIDKVVRGYFPQDYQCTYRRISYSTATATATRHGEIPYPWANTHVTMSIPCGRPPNLA